MITLKIPYYEAKEIVKEIEKQFLRKPMRGFLKQIKEKIAEKEDDNPSLKESN